MRFVVAPRLDHEPSIGSLCGARDGRSARWLNCKQPRLIIEPNAARTASRFRATVGAAQRHRLDGTGLERYVRASAQFVEHLSHICGRSAPHATAAEATFAEQEGHHGVNTFTNYHNASGMGPSIGAGAWVQVSCKVYDPTIQSVNPDGYWYRIASSPWNDAYYSPANTFMNGDPWSGPYTHNTDFSVPDCGSVSPPPGPSATPTVTLAQGPAAPSGYRYAITVTGFAASSTVSVSCRDSVDPGGFYTFSLQANSAGSATTSSYCYSADGPDHWVVANGSVQSNHVTWGASTGSAPSPPSVPSTPAAPSSPTPSSSSAPISDTCETYKGDRISPVLGAIAPRCTCIICTPTDRPWSSTGATSRTT
jgi:hypothetical protein